MNCTQPGCSGQILDGYCSVCGAPGSGGTTSPGVIARVAPTPAPNHSSSNGDVESSRTGSAVSAASESTSTSARLGSTELGSRRRDSQDSNRTHHSRRSGRQRLRAGRIGAGIIQVPPAPEMDPVSAIMTDPHVPEGKRNCPSCGSPVGRSRGGNPGRTSGFCPKCRNPYSFEPKLQVGDMVANQYRVEGCLAHGGLGWIYLARDRNVSGRWVVLKGILNAGDPDAVAAAIAEQQFLAQVQHPLIVEIYNFVLHEGAGYIVMEYVGGRSLKALLKQRMRANNGVYDPLPPDQALAYMLEVLPAFSYLHDLGLLYCDFKPDNVIQIGDGVKLIDLGGVRKMDDDESPIYGTVGYQAPEVPDVGPSVASDIYTIGRSLLVLCAEFRGYQGRYRHSLPDDLPLFAKYDSLHRLLSKCCATDPGDRFITVDELRVQLLGVLREVANTDSNQAATTSVPSLHFDTPAPSSAPLQWDQLPALRPDPSDSQHLWVTNVNLDDPAERLNALAGAPRRTAEVQIARAQAAIELGNHPLVSNIVNEMLSHDPWEWRAVWLAGLSDLKAKRWSEAQAAFNAVYGQVPGELGPKLALAAACEQGGQDELAARLYQICATTDANYVASAAFGLARIRTAAGDNKGTVAALDQVPGTNRGYVEARRMRAEALMNGASDLNELREALLSVEKIRLEAGERDRLITVVLERALDSVRKHGPAAFRIGQWAANDASLRKGLEESYRVQARNAEDVTERYTLVDKANAIRKWSLT